MLTTVSSRRSPIGGSRASASYASYSTFRRAILGQLLKRRPQTSRCSCEFLKILLVCYGTISSSMVVSHLCRHALTMIQLRLQERDRVCRLEEPRRNLLHEFSPAVFVLHTLFPQGGTVLFRSDRNLTIIRLYIKSRRRKTCPQRV
jgi:hypothetical protein